MFTSVYRSVTFIANLVTVLTFIAAFAGWFGLDLLPDYRPPSERVAGLVIVAFAAFASFGVANFVKRRAEDGKEFVLICLVLIGAYVFSAIFVREYVTEGMTLAPNSFLAGADGITGVALWAALMFIHVMPMWYPEGFSFWRYFTLAFRKEGWIGLGLIALYGLAILLCYFAMSGTAGTSPTA